MDMKELRLKSPEELRRQSTELRASIRDMRFKLATRQLTKMKGLHEAKKELARIETVLANPIKERT